MQSSGVGSDEIGILLLDQVQRFRTVDEDNKQIRQGSTFGDIWQLLSDGKFAYNTKTKEGILWTIKELVSDVEQDQLNRLNIAQTTTKKNKSKQYKMNT